MTIEITEARREYTIGVYNGVDYFTECDDCGLLNILCGEDGAAQYCDTCEPLHEGEL